MNYYKVGHQMRKFRKAHGLSQEQLAKRVDISTTHMSHIETGGTKLSLPVLVEIANVLEVSTDDLLNNQVPNCGARSEITAILESCSAQQVNVIANIVKAAKLSMDKYL